MGLKADGWMRKFANDRNYAFTRFALYDDWEALKKYAREYAVPLPWDNPKVCAGAVYKACAEITSPSEEVREKAAEKCLALGFKSATFTGYTPAGAGLSGD